MREIYFKNIGKILKNKKFLEKELKVKIQVKNNNLYISGKEVDEYLANKVIEAICFGFKINTALLLKNEDYMFEKLNIKDLTKRKNLEEIRGRIIGTNGRTLRNLCNLSNCEIILRENDVAIIGTTEDVEVTTQAITSLIQGSKQTSVYSYLERQNKTKKKFDHQDLGLKVSEDEQ